MLKNKLGKMFNCSTKFNNQEKSRHVPKYLKADSDIKADKSNNCSFMSIYFFYFFYFSSLFSYFCLHILIHDFLLYFYLETFHPIKSLTPPLQVNNGGYSFSHSFAVAYFQFQPMPKNTFNIHRLILFLIFFFFSF